MKASVRGPSFVVVLLGLAWAGTGLCEALKPDAEIPGPVSQMFKRAFPKAEIEKIDALVENGVMVYDFEFRDGKYEKETDIAADGTMLEHTLVVKPKAVPPQAMKVIKEYSKGATVERLEEIKITYETKDGKIVKLPKLTIHYAAEMKRGKNTAEVVVTESGALVDTPKWPESKGSKAKPEGSGQ